MPCDTINLITEPLNATPIWYLESFASLKVEATKRHYTVKNINDPNEVRNSGVDSDAAIVLSTNINWTWNAIQVLQKLNIRPVLVGTVPSVFGEFSGALPDRRAAIERFVQYFHEVGRDRMALVGVNPASSNDLIKRDAFLSATSLLNLPISERDVYDRSKDSVVSIIEFLSHTSKYDAAICVNDYVAVTLLAESRNKGIRIPEDLYVSGFGNHILGRCTYPTLTTSTLDYSEMGIQAVAIWEALCKNPQITSIVTTVKHEIIVRESTDYYIPLKLNSLVYKPPRLKDATLESACRQVKNLEECLRKCDEIDYQIINNLIKGVTYEQIGFELFLSRSAIRRRIKKIFDMAGALSREAFETIARKYMPNFEHFIESSFSNIKE